MSISANRSKRSRQAFRTMLVYLGVSVFCVIFDRVYSLYGHGVYSASMSLMFLYPLIGGSLVFLLLWLLKPTADAAPHYRVYYNLYNSGIAALTAGSMLKGVFDIAGTSSPYTVIYFICGWALIAVGVIGFLLNSGRDKGKIRDTHMPDESL